MRTLCRIAVSLALFATAAPSLAQNSSIEIDKDLTLTTGDLDCNGTLYIHVVPEQTVEITLPAYSSMSACTPSVIVTADNQATFTVIYDSIEILHAFTTRGGVYRNAANNLWKRFQ